MSTTTNLTFLQRNLLDDAGTGIWSAAELYDDMDVETSPFYCTLTMISTTAFTSGKTFWVEKGTGAGKAPELTIGSAGTAYGTSLYTLDYLKGEVSFATGLSTSAVVDATFYACNLYAAAMHAALRRMNSTAVSGQQTAIRLGPLSKSVSGPDVMVLSFQEKINSFSRFSARWRSQGRPSPRIRL